MSTKKKTSLLKRAIYFAVMLMSGGGAGIGGWALKDYPQLQALLGMVVGHEEAASLDGATLKTALVEVVKSSINKDDGRQPGVYKVKITELRLDPKLFPVGRSVDIQARVRRIDGQGREIMVWESKNYGENLAVVGKDELVADWQKRPFEIDWAPGDKVVVDVWDRKSGFFDQKEFRMAAPEPGAFPLASGTHALEPAGRSRSTRDSDLNRIAFQAQRVTGSSRSSGPEPKQVAERPIVIK